MGYPVVEIANSTNWTVSGTVAYASMFCSDDDYSAGAFTAWQASSRGLCLVTGISATVEMPNGDVDAASYSSSGTSFNAFAVIQTAPNTFEVICRTTAPENDVVPAGYTEPTEKQK